MLVYYERDVMKRARQVHGSAEAVARLLRLSAELPGEVEDDTSGSAFSSAERRRESDYVISYLNEYTVFLQTPRPPTLVALCTGRSQ